MNPQNKIVAWAFLVAFSCSLALAQTYKVTDLGVLPGDSGSAGFSINSFGRVTGCSDGSTTQNNLCAFVLPSHAFLWSSSGGMQDLGTLSGDDLSIGFNINDSGAVVGFSANTQSGMGHGFLWTKSGGMIDLGTLPGGSAYSDADAITSKGVIAGEALVSNGDINAVLWTKSGGTYHIHNVGRLPHSVYTFPYYINDNNQVVGPAYFDTKETRYHGFLWSKAGGWKDLGTLPGGMNSFAVWINGSGVIVGMATSAKFPKGVAVYWDAAGKIHMIGALKGGTSSFADAINDAGQVVGHSTVSGGASHAFLWSSNTGLKDLNKLIGTNSGWVLHAAYGINKNGQIVGYGTKSGANHAFLLKR